MKILKKTTKVRIWIANILLISSVFFSPFTLRNVFADKDTPCIPGELRKQHAVAHAGAKVGSFTTRTNVSQGVYQPSDGWYIESYEYIQTSKFGSTSHSVSQVQANSRIATSSELSDAFDYTLNIAGKYEDQAAEAKLKELRKTLISYAATIESSHEALILNVKAHGRGSLSDKGSSINAYLLVTERCIGASDVEILKQQLSSYLSGQKIYFSNQCFEPVWLALAYKDNGRNQIIDSGWYFRPGRSAFLANDDGPLLTVDPDILYHAQSDGGNAFTWEGSNDVLLFGNVVSMRSYTLWEDSDGDLRLTLVCN